MATRIGGHCAGDKVVRPCRSPLRRRIALAPHPSRLLHPTMRSCAWRRDARSSLPGIGTSDGHGANGYLAGLVSIHEMAERIDVQLRYRDASIEVPDAVPHSQGAQSRSAGPDARLESTQRVVEPSAREYERLSSPPRRPRVAVSNKELLASAWVIPEAMAPSESSPRCFEGATARAE